MTNPSLKQTTIRALLWNLVDRMGQQLLLFGVGIVVANILSVDDYALVGMLAIFTALANIVLDSGFSSALIRQQDATEEDYNSVFYFNLGISAVLYLALYAAAPLIADYYAKPSLVLLSRILFLALPFNSLSLIQTTLLNKQVKFQTLTKVNLLSLLFSSSGMLLMAFAGMGVWTLAWQPVILAFSRSLLLWLQRTWRPRLLFSFARIRLLFRFASGLLLASVINAIFTNIYSVAIGKLCPSQQMGYYTQGNKFSLMVISAVYSSLQTATYPIFSSIQNDRERSLRSYRKTIRFTAFLTFPLLMGLVSVAPSFIALVLKAEWAGCVPFFQLTCLAGIFTILTSVNQNFAKVSGRSDVILKLEVVRTVLIIGCLFATLGQPALVMILFQTVAQAAIYLISMAYIGSLVGYRWNSQLKDLLPYAVLSLAMWAVLLVPGAFIRSDAVLLPLKIAVGMGFYYAANRWLGSTILKEATELLLKRKIN
ncbi:MAG: lipopolysaccharide biosynthesis protein [Bacteroides sp.]